MHKILTDLQVFGNVSFSGKLNGKIPFVSPSATPIEAKTFSTENEYNEWIDGLKKGIVNTVVETYNVSITPLGNLGSRQVQTIPAPDGKYIKIKYNVIEDGILVTKVVSSFIKLGDTASYDIDQITIPSSLLIDNGANNALIYKTINDMKVLSCPISTDSGNAIVKKANGLFAELSSNITYITEKTDYNTLTNDGWYSIVGLLIGDMYKYHAPYDSTSDVLMQVTKHVINNVTYVTQIAYGSLQTGTPIVNAISIRTGIINSMPDFWETINTTEYLTTKFVKTGILQSLDASIGYGGSSIYGYKPEKLGLPQSAPTNKEGTAIWLQSGYKNSDIGTYSGFTLASDVDGRLFLNVENNQVSDDKIWDWKEILTLDSPVLVSSTPNNALVKNNDGLYVAQTPVSDVVVSNDTQNQLTNLVGGEHPGLYVRPVSMQLSPDDSIYSANNSSDPKNTDIRVRLSSDQYNILKLSTSANKGLYVAGNHPVIPKFTTASTNLLFNSATVYPNGSMKIKASLTLNNPTGVTKYNNVGLYNSVQARLEQYCLDSDGNPIQTDVSVKINTTTTSTITVSITVFLYGTPALAFDMANDNPYPSAGTKPTELNMAVTLLVGTTINNAF